MDSPPAFAVFEESDVALATSEIEYRYLLTALTTSEIFSAMVNPQLFTPVNFFLIYYSVFYGQSKIFIVLISNFSNPNFISFVMASYVIPVSMRFSRRSHS